MVTHLRRNIQLQGDFTCGPNSGLTLIDPMHLKIKTKVGTYRADQIPKLCLRTPFTKSPYIYWLIRKLEAGHSIECITALRPLDRLFQFVTLWPWPLTFWPQNHATCRISELDHSLYQIWTLWVDHSFLSYHADRHRLTEREFICQET